jgi:HEXXH motif-containing protein
VTSADSRISSRPDALSELYPSYSGFASPYGGDTCDFFQLLAAEYSRTLCQAFLARFREPLEQSAGGLLPIIDAWVQEPGRFDEVFHPNFGLVRQALDGDDPVAAVGAAAALALQLHASGLEGTWSAMIQQPTGLLWGSCRLPAAERIEVDAGACRVTVTVHTGRSVQQIRMLSTGSSWEAPHPGRLAGFHLADARICILKPPGPESRRLLLAGDAEVSDADAAHLKRISQAAADLLDRAAPEYARWVARAVWGVVPARARGGELISGSVRACPWLVEACYPATPDQLAELLVHEASHQYFYLLSQLGPVDDGSDPTLYYSPLKDTGRPIGMILLAYHACVNMLLLHRAFANTGHDTDFTRHREAVLAEQVAVLGHHLRTATSLTQIGQALWQPMPVKLVP